MKKSIKLFASVLLILGAISLMNFAIPQIDPMTETTIPSQASLGELVTVDCFQLVIRPGGSMENYACDIDVNGTCYDCIWVDNAAMQMLSFCETDFPVH